MQFKAFLTLWAVLAVFGGLATSDSIDLKSCIFNIDGYTYDLAPLSTHDTIVFGTNSDVLYLGVCQNTQMCHDTPACLVDRAAEHISYGSLDHMVVTDNILNAPGKGLSLTYQQGDFCAANGEKRMITVSYICDHSTVNEVVDFDENACHGIVTIRSKYACPVPEDLDTCTLKSNKSSCLASCGCGWCLNAGCLRAHDTCKTNMELASESVCPGKDHNDAKLTIGLSTSFGALGLVAIFLTILCVSCCCCKSKVMKKLEKRRQAKKAQMTKDGSEYSLLTSGDIEIVGDHGDDDFHIPTPGNTAGEQVTRTGDEMPSLYPRTAVGSSLMAYPPLASETPQ